MPDFGNPYGLSDLKAAHLAWKIKKYFLKFYAKAGEESCQRPVNALTRSLIVTGTDADAGKGKLNFIHIAAAREVARRWGASDGLS